MPSLAESRERIDRLRAYAAVAGGGWFVQANVKSGAAPVIDNKPSWRAR